MFILILGWCNYVTAQVPFFKQVWLNEPDISVNVNDIIYQPNGYVWMATNNGVYYYNGRIFTQLSNDNDNVCTAICACGDRVVAGYKNGSLAYITGQKITPLIFKNGQPKSSITTIRALNDQTLLIATEDEGLYVSFKNNLIAINNENGLSDNFISDIAVGNNDLLLATDNGINILKINNAQIHFDYITTANHLPDDIVTCISTDNNKRLYWIGTQQAGIALYDAIAKRVIIPKTNTAWHFGQVNDLMSLDENNAWAITEDGYLLQIKRVNDSATITAYTTDCKLKKLVKDKTGNIWCATNKGLLMNTALYLSHISLPEKFKLNDYTVMTCDESNNLWFTQNEKLFKIKANDTIATLVSTLPASATALFAIPHQGLWIGTFGKGLYHYTTSQSLQKASIPSLTNGHILSLSQRDKDLWVASFTGLDQLDIQSSEPKIIHHYNKRNGTGSDYIYHLNTDHYGRIWMATDGGGVTMYDGNEFHKWDTADGQTNDVFYCVISDKKGNIWASSIDKGLYKYNGKQWNCFTQNDGLQDMNITALAADGNGNITIVNRNGIDQWYAQDKQFRHFNRRTGIGIDSNSKMLNCIASDSLGNVYVPYEKGILVFRQIAANESIHPDIQIRSQSLFFKELPFAQKRFSYDENHISFTYEGINFSNPDRLHYRYKLIGYDDNWVTTTNETIPFAQLNPGHYNFRVQASLSDDFKYAAEDSYSFYIKKPFWATPWFIISFVALVSSSIYFFIKRRERSIVKMNQLQRERLVYEYEHLKSQVNPHFLFNSFNTLVNIIEENKDAAIDYTVHLSDLYRNMLAYKDKDLISLKEEYGIIQNYIYIQKSRFGEALQIHEELDEELLLTKKIIPFALQILLENAVKHNIVSFSNPLHIHIFAYNDELIIKNNLQEKITKDISTGIGIENICKRYALITQRTVTYGIVNNEYIVRLPLL